MRIEAVDFFYLAEPVVTDAGDGSQDALLVRVAAGGQIGWGECEAAPLPSIAAFVCPMSHGACKPVAASVLGQQLESPADIARIAHRLAWDSMDLLQAPHTWSGIEMALWDLLGKARGEPVWKLLGYAETYPKTPYASQLFGDTPQATLVSCREQIAAGFTAVKCGWGPFGRGTLADDIDHLHAAREGLGPEGILLVDAGAVFIEDIEAAASRLPALEAVNAIWYEEPFTGMSYEAYAELAPRCRSVRLAGGEAAHNVAMARHTMAYGKVGFIQIDCGRIGGIGPARQVASLAVERGVTYVNHTFTSDLALSASLQPFAGLADHRLCELPVHTRPVAKAFCQGKLWPDENGALHLPEGPGLGIAIEPAGIRRYLQDVEISVGGKTLYATPKPD